MKIEQQRFSSDLIALKLMAENHDESEQLEFLLDLVKGNRSGTDAHCDHHQCRCARLPAAEEHLG